MNRRTCLAFGAAAVSRALAFSLADFWATKEAAEWSEKDVQRMLNHSPWAKEVAVVQSQSSPLENGDMSGGRRGGRGGGGGSMDASNGAGMGGGGGGMGGAGMGGGGGRGAGGGGMEGGMQSRPEVKALVRWESAHPIRDAVKKEFPKQLGDAYVISVSGVRLGGGMHGREVGADPAQANERHQQMAEALKAATHLERKGSDPIAPSQVQSGQITTGPISYFVFPRGSQPIQESDKEVTFHIKLERMEVKAKFTLKEMMYKGELAL